MKNDILHKLLSLGVQLKINDGNLKVNAPKGVLTTELLEEIKEHKVYLMSLIAISTSIPKAEVKESYALTPTQYFMWFTHEYLGGDRAYNITSTLKLQGKINETLLEKAFQQVILRHEALRTIFKKNQKEEIQQYILSNEETEFKLHTLALQHFSVEQLHNQIKEEYQKVFDLEKDLLLSATLLKSSEEEHILVFVLHHIIGDGWSLQLLTREVMLVYNSLASAQAIELPELSIQYKDYSEWLNGKLVSPEYIAKLEYWKQQFQTKSPVLDLIQGKRPAVKTYNGRIHNHEFSKHFLGELNAFAKEHQMTLFMLLMGGLNGLFSKYTGQTDITLGTTVAGREHADLEHQIGLYSNALPIRIQFEKEDSFAQLMQKQKQTLIKAYENKEYPFTALVNHLTLPKNQSRSALFDIMVLLQNHQGLEINDQKGINGVVASEYSEIERGVSQLDISFVFVEKEESLSLSVEYNTDIYNESFIVSLLHHFEGFIKSGLQKPNQSVDAIEIVTLTEKNKILTEFNTPSISSESSLTIIDLIKAIAVENPSQTALVYQEEEISYTLLEKYSNKLANYLEQHLHVEKGDFIGIELERNSWTIITILAVLKAGGVYIPIDPAYPEERKSYIKQDSYCKLTITNAVLEEFKSISDSYIGEYTPEITPTDLAYVIYTSGSTGNPKGVQITHASLIDYAVTFKDYFQLSSQDSIVQQASISFDTSIEEIFPILISGGTLVVYESKGDFQTLFRLCEHSNITILSTNPYALQYLNGAHKQYNLKIRILISGGDVLQPDYINNLWDNIAIYNTYGPTESTVCATYYKVSEKQAAIPIGKPISNRQVYILEPETTQLSPLGVVGELCISGKGLSAGYLNQQELTAEKFVPNPFIEGEKMYRTGDLAYWYPDGNIEYMGRIDHQVKIRGFRIELGEIETAVLQYSDDLRQTVVAVKESNGEKVLVAYYVSNEELDKSAIRTYLQGKLPEYMVPGFYVALENLPLTPNGKTDRKALPEISGEDLIRKEYVSPRNTIEEDLANIWQEVLKVDKIGITDNFFELGGHSLIAAQVINRIQKQLSKKVSFKDFFSKPTIEGLSQQLTEACYVSIAQAPLQESYPLTASQNRLWLLSQLDGGSQAYNIPFAFELSGTLDKDKFEASFEKVIERHEILRTRFKADESGLVRQHILPADSVTFRLIREDFTSVNRQQEAVSDYLQEQSNFAFDLEKAPLLRAGLVELDTQKHVFFLSMHHIIGDGWSLELLVSEVVKIYNALSQGLEIELPALKIQYKDYAVWLTKELQQEKHLKAKEFWMSQFSGEIPVLDLPSFKKRPLMQSYKGESINRTFSQAFSQKLKTYSKTQDATLFMTLIAGVKTLLYRYTGQNDIIIGTPIAGREHPDLENQAGLYLNTLAIRTQFKEKAQFTEIVNQEKRTLLEAYQHQNYPFDDLIGNLNLKRDMSRSALFDVMVVLQNQGQLKNLVNGEELTGLEIKNYEFKSKTSQFDVSFVFIEKEEGLSLTIQYNTDLYDSLLIERMFAHLELLMTQAIDESSLTLEELSYITAEEKLEVTETFNDTLADYSKDRTIIDMFEEQAAKTPDKIAVVFENKELSYRSLNEQANQLGAYLRKHYDIKYDDLIGIKLERSERMMVAILGILKSGAAYVPIDLTYPQSRIEYIEQDSNSKLIIDEAVLELFYKEQQDYSTSNIEKNNGPKDLAYVIYTSGTTGNPKGVMVEHTALVNRLEWMQNFYPIVEDDVILQKTSYSFDVSVWELFWWSFTGSKLCVLKPDGQKSPKEIIDHIKKYKVSVLHFVPSMLNLFLDYLEENKHEIQNLESLKRVFTSGEALTADQNRNFFLQLANVSLVNLYGPTEATIDVSYFNCSENLLSVPIGKPIENMQLYVLSDDLKALPVGIVGKLYISGVGLARGYVNKQELTAEKFVPNPFIEGEKMYDTGDLAYWYPDGNIEYMGRIDHQVKIRGFRIELGEIETAVLQYSDDLRQTVVAVKESNGEKVLVAYYVSNEELDKSAIRTYLQGKLPEYMVPGFYVALENLPLTPNGKTDRKALPEISGEDLIRKEYVSPRNTIEEDLANIWQEVLKVDKIGITDNFFELGGHSLIAAQVINRIQKQLSKKVSFKDFFSKPTIEGLSQQLTEACYVSIAQAPLQESYPLTASQNRLWLLSQLDGGSQAYNIPFAFELSGTLDKDKFEASFEKVIERHEILRTRFKADESGLVRQHILPADSVTFRLIREDFTSVNRQQEAVSDYLQEQSNFAFDLEKAPLLRAGLVELDTQKHVFFLSMHHIIGDGWSLELLVSEVVKIYNALSQGLEIELPALKIQYKDYAVWLTKELQQEKHLKAKEFWMSQFSGEIPVLDLPSFKKRPLMQSYKGESINRTFSQAFSQKLKTYSKTQDATLFMTLIAGVKTLLYRYTGQNDIIIGTPIAGREHPDLENQAGLYLNTLAIRTQFKEKAQFTEIVNQEKRTLLEAYQHQNYPFDDLIGNLNLKRDMSRSALFDVMVVLQNQGQLKNLVNGEELTGLEIKNYEFKSKTSQFDVSFVFIEKEEGLSLTIQYNTDLYDSLLIERMFAHLELLMTQAIDESSLTLEELSYITAEEKLEVTETFNDTLADYSKDRTIIDMFEEQAAKTPDKIAVVFENKELSYRSLNEQANQLGAYLRKHYDIKYDDLIGIKLERSERMMVAILGILKSGAAYVPIDLTYPQSRIEYIEQDSNSKLIIDEAVLELFYKEQQNYSTSNIEKNNGPKDLAYVIYTSGTTGNPKGVMVEHSNATALIDWSKEEYAQSKFDMVYAVTSYCFDLSVYEFFFTLTTGKTLRILKNALDIATYSHIDKNVLLNTVPSVVRKLLEDNISFENINVLNMAGEILPTDIIDQLPLESIEVRNLYGPSEDTTYSTCYLITVKNQRTISVGRPISNTQAWILNESLSPVPIGVTGKIYLSGKGITRGYLNKPELTTEKFIANPFIEGERMYDTGDLAYWQPDGNIEFIGRKDHQVKIRGFRIELGEIETAISKYSEFIKQVILEAKEIKSTQVLAAYYVASESIDKGELRNYLQTILPEFMIPNYYVQLENMPLTPNGKVDKKALPDISGEDVIKKEYVAPTNEIEEKLVLIWQEVLKIDKIGITDNFFELGGHSLIVGQVINQINKQFDVLINIKEIFMSPTIEILALNIENAKWLEEAVLEDSATKIFI
ncbi:amino acid adenylation domain-containing protein [Flavobacterium sp. LS1R49]|uniref:Amino acid adenylation domain-containing protein n=1 Tax=Flavobacterium shii TaxID=2987687 RepID=A0A9X2ZAZ1_9FLAO|nr:non-ribosomal peptide synthetase [Flavobacterium shii]MCV9927841.1 amino acid adenylation domain-containing protein [Flavobacterium shii]